VASTAPSWSLPAFRHENIAVYAEIMAKSAAVALGRWQDGDSRDLHHEMAELDSGHRAKSLVGAKVFPTRANDHEELRR